MMDAVLALQSMEEAAPEFDAAPGVTGMGSMVSYYSSCSTTCVPEIEQPHL